MALPGMGPPSFGGGAPVLDENGMPVANLRRVLRASPTQVKTLSTHRSPAQRIESPHPEDGVVLTPDSHHANSSDYDRRFSPSPSPGVPRQRVSGLSELRGISHHELDARARKELAQKKMLEEQIEERRRKKELEQQRVRREKEKELEELLQNDPAFAEKYAAYHGRHAKPARRSRPSHEVEDAQGRGSHHHDDGHAFREEATTRSRHHRAFDARHERDDSPGGSGRARLSRDREDHLRDPDPVSTPNRRRRVKSPYEHRTRSAGDPRYSDEHEVDAVDGPSARAVPGGIMSLLGKGTRSSPGHSGAVDQGATRSRREQLPRPQGHFEDPSLDVQELAELCDTLLREQKHLKDKLQEQEEMIAELQANKAAPRVRRKPGVAPPARRVPENEAETKQRRGRGSMEDKRMPPQRTGPNQKVPRKVAFGRAVSSGPPKKKSSMALHAKGASASEKHEQEPVKRFAKSKIPRRSRDDKPDRGAVSRRKPNALPVRIASHDPAEEEELASYNELRGESIMYPFSLDDEAGVDMDQLDRLVSRVRM